MDWPKSKVVALTVALVASLALSSAAVAQPMSQNQFKAARSELEVSTRDFVVAFRFDDA